MLIEQEWKKNSPFYNDLNFILIYKNGDLSIEFLYLKWLEVIYWFFLGFSLCIFNEEYITSEFVFFLILKKLIKFTI